MDPGDDPRSVRAAAQRRRTCAVHLTRNLPGVSVTTALSTSRHRSVAAEGCHAPASKEESVTTNLDLRELDRMRPPAEARAIVDRHITLLPTETVSLDQAAGRILA